MNKRIQKKKQKQYFYQLATQADVDIVSNRKIKQKQLINIKQINQDFDNWFTHEFKPKRSDQNRISR